MKNTNQTSHLMKKSICLVASLFTLNVMSVLGQPMSTPPPPAGDFQQRLQRIVDRANPPANQPTLTKFNLDFPGGTPAELVKAIENATGKPLNAIIPTEDADIQLPPLKMNDVVTPQLFAALEAASRKTVAVQNQMFGNSYSQVTTDYGFKTSDNPITDTSIWYFHAEKPTLPPVVSNERICRFYQLASYLDRGFTVDDVTTAVQTGWKMAGVNPPPELNYHKETKLLIAYGQPDDLNIIQSVLQSLPESNTTSTEIGRINSQINTLTKEVAELKKMASVPVPSTGALEEKSGK
jgi:hypothetical protein